MPSLAQLTAEQTPLYKQTEPVQQMPDERDLSRPATRRSRTASSTTGVENYKEFWYSLVGLASIGQSFDGNGPVGQFLVGNSGQTLQVGSRSSRARQPTSKANCACSRTHRCRRSARARRIPAEEPPYKPLVPCYTQALPELQRPALAGARRRERMRR